MAKFVSMQVWECHPANLKRPFCLDCYNVWAKWENRDNIENSSHSCAYYPAFLNVRNQDVNGT